MIRIFRKKRLKLSKSDTSSVRLYNMMYAIWYDVRRDVNNNVEIEKIAQGILIQTGGSFPRHFRTLL